MYPIQAATARRQRSTFITMNSIGGQRVYRKSKGEKQEDVNSNGMSANSDRSLFTEHYFINYKKDDIMKQVLFLIIALTSCLSVSAQDYKNILTEGKRWKVLVRHWPHEDLYLDFRVSGDTIVNGRNCKRITNDQGTTPYICGIRRRPETVLYGLWQSFATAGYGSEDR